MAVPLDASKSQKVYDWCQWIRNRAQWDQTDPPSDAEAHHMLGEINVIAQMIQSLAGDGSGEL